MVERGRDCAWQNPVFAVSFEESSEIGDLDNNLYR